MKGIILAGGSGTRLYPLTKITSKQLLPIYDKPMVYYPLSTLMLAKIKDILIISTPNDIGNFERLLGDGSNLGINLHYMVQNSPDGLAQAFVIGKDFIGEDSVAMILGDNIFYGAGLTKYLSDAAVRANSGIATVFGYYVNDPQRFGIVELDKNGNAISLEEKPLKPKSNYCVTGLYFYPPGCSEVASSIKKSERGEYEITDMNKYYLHKKTLFVSTLGRGFSWLDTGTHESLIEASQYVKTIEDHQGLKICCPEEIAFLNGWITKKQLIEIGESMSNNCYGKYLLKIAKGGIIYPKVTKND